MTMHHLLVLFRAPFSAIGFANVRSPLKIDKRAGLLLGAMSRRTGNDQRPPSDLLSKRMLVGASVVFERYDQHRNWRSPHDPFRDGAQEGVIGSMFMSAHDDDATVKFFGPLQNRFGKMSFNQFN